MMADAEQQSMHELDSQTQDTDNLLDKERDRSYENGKGNSMTGMRNIKVKLTFAVVCLILLTLISFGGGLLLGWRLFDHLKDSDSINTISNDWGESVIIDGRGSVPVDDWIRENIIPENIKNNLM